MHAQPSALSARPHPVQSRWPRCARTCWRGCVRRARAWPPSSCSSSLRPWAPAAASPPSCAPPPASSSGPQSQCPVSVRPAAHAAVGGLPMPLNLLGGAAAVPPVRPAATRLQRTWAWCWRGKNCWGSLARRAAWHQMPTLEASADCIVQFVLAVMAAALRRTPPPPTTPKHPTPPRTQVPPPPAALSLACPAGPTTAAGMAAAKGWRSSMVPALLIGIMGYATATFVGVAAAAVFRRMQFM